MAAEAGTVMIGESSKMKRLRELIRRLGPRSEPVLLQGPTGSGKELVAQAIHKQSGRTGRLVAFNVCAIPESMFEDALFGHVRGAFTGAASDSLGFLAEADKGTAFFDEISGLSLQMQVKLLRAIETGVFRPVGARGDRRSEFRIVASLNEPLNSLVSDGRFRHDLAHRIGVFVLEVPPLRDRREDIPTLARHFAANTTADHLASIALSACAIRALQDYEWPGNVRELRNVIFAMVAMAESPILDGPAVVNTLMSRGASVPVADKVDYQRRQLLDVLNRHAWNTGQAARELGVDRATVYRRMNALGISTVVRSAARTPIELQ